MKETQVRLCEESRVKYSYGPYNKYNDSQQYIRISEGCPNQCPYCHEPSEFKVFGIPEIVRNDVKVMDMNLLCKPEAEGILGDLADIRVNGKVVYFDFICGFDYRFMTPKLAKLIKKARVQKVRLAWDWFYKDQYAIKEAIDCLLKAGYRGREIMLFMICNWRIPFEECCRKLDLMKVWGVEVSDCYFDNQTHPGVVPLHWTDQENKEFRRKCRKHNQLVYNRYDPEVR